MEKFVIKGGYPLSGAVEPAGNKNAALPLLAATLLTEEPVILHNVPSIRDVIDMRSLLDSLGVLNPAYFGTFLEDTGKIRSSCQFGS